MDISAILPVNMGASESSSLNDDFSATTPAGDSIFDKPLGARTIFQTPTGGAIVASFVFDPKQKYSEDHIMASVTTDYMAELRDGLTKCLLDPKDIVSKTKTLEETVWEQLTTSLPKETLAKNLFNDKELFDQYKQIITTNATKSYIEEDLLTKAMREKAFSFSFEIAIDAYPGDLGSKETKKNGNRTGVLTFHIEGIPDGKVPEAASAPEDEDEQRTRTKKRKTDDSKKNDKDQLLDDLALTEFYAHAHVEKVKKFHPSAYAFFEALNRWFGSVVSRRSAKLEKDRNRNPLYH